MEEMQLTQRGGILPGLLTCSCPPVLHHANFTQSQEARELGKWGSLGCTSGPEPGTPCVRRDCTLQPPLQLAVPCGELSFGI